MDLHIFGVNGNSFEVEIQQLPFLGQAAASVKFLRPAVGRDDFLLVEAAGNEVLFFLLNLHGQSLFVGFQLVKGF